MPRSPPATCRRSKTGFPIEPLVVLGVDGPGLYGGTFFNATYDVGLATALRDETAIILNKHSFTADPYPNVTKSYTAVDDSSSVWELKLREGLLWSDGTPFTTADFTFWWDDVILNTDITPQLRPQYRGVTITAIDDYTVQFDFGVPADFVARGGGFNPITRFPRHYLEQFHARVCQRVGSGGHGEEVRVRVVDPVLPGSRRLQRVRKRGQAPRWSPGSSAKRRPPTR